MQQSSRDSLVATASIWSRLPNEEKAAARGRVSPASTSTDSLSVSIGAPPRPPLPSSLADQVPSPSAAPAAALKQYASSPRSSISSSSFSPTPDSDRSPRDRLAASKALGPAPPTRLSPHYSHSLGLYPDPSSPRSTFISLGGVPRDPYADTLSHLPSGVTAPASADTLSPPVAVSQPAPAPPSSTASNQPLLAEIFSGNPRPHYRASFSTPAPGPSLVPHNGHGASPRSNGSALLSPPSQTDNRPSYFAPPPPDSAHGRARSHSSLGIEKPASPMNMSGNNAMGSGSRAPGAASGAADQHGFRPSSTLPGGGGHFSASLPTTSAVGSPTYATSSLMGGREIGGGSPNRASVSGYSPFGPSLSTGLGSTGASALTGGSGAADSQSGWRPSPGSGLSHSFGAGWNDDLLSAGTGGDHRSSSAERDGRSRFRDQWSSAPFSQTPSQQAVLSSSASSTSTGGIGMSNMSPFTRDGTRTLADLPASVSGALGGDGTWGTGGLGPPGSGAAYRIKREYSLGAVGSGRKRSDSAAWGRSGALKEMDNEDGDFDPDDVFAPPTRSGATSRRHSFAAFEPPSRSGTSHQFGFHLPLDGGGTSGGGGGAGAGGFGPLVDQSSASPSNGWKSGLGSSAINDDDLAADLNSLHLNLEAHVAATAHEPSKVARFAQVGSMPADFPPARSSRELEHSRSPPPHRVSGAPTAGSVAYSQAPPSTSPRATAEPFIPSHPHSTSAASRFLGSLPAPTPLPPATTPATAVATASPGSRFDFSSAPRQPGPPAPYQPAQPQARYGGFGGLPPPVPPPSTQHQYYTPGPATGPLSPRGLSGLPPTLPSQHAPSAFPAFGSSTLPPPHIPHQSQQQLAQPPPGYFNAPPPPPPHVAHHALPPGAPSLTTQAQNDMNLGRGVPLHAIPPDAPLCIVGFKAGRKDLFFCEDPNLRLEEGDLVIVEADRGRDVGKYIKSCTIEEVHKFQQHLVELALGQLANPNNQAHNGGVGGPMGGGPGGGGAGGGAGGAGPAQLARMTKECQPKRIYGKAGPADTHALLAKAQDEIKALALVRSKVAQKGLPMEILDAEWQWDRRKLTFYYTADQRVDFRELVRELFRIWKTRVWLCCLDQQQPSFDIK
ncbi:uncharacterized protein JCM10292_005583 [Rhodotorula paludigena]|uniref:uncharacterized protein n=1 Tax=Rhodotorula paludigena TaxID=86838 RepID=UPI00316EB809